MNQEGFRSASVLALRCGVAAWLVAAPSFLSASEGTAQPIAPVGVAPAGDVVKNAVVAPPTAAGLPTSKSGVSSYATSPISDQKSSMGIKMFTGAGDLKGFDAQRSPFDAKMSPFDMKSSDLTDRRAEIGGRSIYSPMVTSFDKRIDVPQNGLFQGMSPMSSAVTTAAGQKTSVFDAKRADGFDKTVTVSNYKGREADAILHPRPFAEGMMGEGDSMTTQFVRNGGSFGAVEHEGGTMSLEEVRNLLNRDTKGASLQIPIPAAPKP